LFHRFSATFVSRLVPRIRSDAQSSLSVFAGWTVCEAVIMANICTRFDLRVVLLALAQTAAATTGLTLYGFVKNPRFDLTGAGSVLFASLLALVLTMVLGPFLGISIDSLAVSYLGAVLMCAYIVYDTQLIVGGEHKKAQLRTTEYVLGAMMLYIHVADLFIFLMKIASKSQRDD